MAKNWYVIRVQSGLEDTLSNKIKRKLQLADLDRFVRNVVVPKQKVTEIKEGKKKIREMKLYPGYFFMEMQLVEEMSDEPQGLELGEAVQAASGGPDMELPIEDLELSERPRNCLKRAQVNTVGELLQKSEDDLLAITNFGQKSLDEVIEKLDERGLSLRNRD